MVILTDQEVRTLIIIERCTASISVFSTLVLVSTFIFIQEFRTLSNTLIFYASFANIFANVAALIGGSALTFENGALCQFQGFLLEMFMQSDPLWSCAMAVNVYLVFFRRYDATSLKKLYWIYGLICYGLPFVPAIFCLFYRSKEKGKMYGNATLWCWIDNDWAPIRIYSYYAPIWLAILVTFFIYLRVGVEIFQKRTQLKAAFDGKYVSSSEIHDSINAIKSCQSPFTGIRTTEIRVTTDPWTLAPLPSSSQTYPHNEKDHSDQYSITISSLAPKISPRNPTSGVHKRKTTSSPKRPGPSVDKVKWAYTKCAILFAMSILITWVPASVNRVHGLRYPKDPSFALNIGSAVVLPLQGFWNSVIYFVTSLGICRSVLASWTEERNRNKKVWTGEIIHLGGRRENNGGGWVQAEDESRASSPR